MENVAKVSLISGCFNGEKFIEQCFQSVLGQTYPNVEFIFVDDGSTDNSLKIAEKFQGKFIEKGYEFILISQKNQGFYPQTGIREATGKYIATLDVDDLLLPESLEKRVAFLEEKTNFMGVRTNGYFVPENNLDLKTSLFITKEDEKQKIDIFEDLLYGRTNNWAGSYMVKSSELFKHYPDKKIPMNRFGQNLQILMPVSYNAKIGFVDLPLMKYVKHQESFTASAKNYELKIEQFREFKKIREEILDLLKVDDAKIKKNLDEVYCKIFLDTAYEHNKKEEFNKFYLELGNKAIEDKIKHKKINKETMSFYFLRLKKFLTQKLRKKQSEFTFFNS